MKLEDTIYIRKSTRHYLKEEIDLSEIINFTKKVKHLNDNIDVSFKFIKNDKVKCILPWKAPHYIAFFSEVKDNYLENAGFILQQLDLFIQSKNLGCCYLGLGEYTPKDKDIKDNKEYIIMLALGKAEYTPHRTIDKFNRKQLNEICNSNDIILNSARLAPSSVNSQPWYFVKKENYYDVYCTNHKILMGKDLSKMNKIDIGICLCHLYLENKNTFKYFINKNTESLKGYYYICSINL